VRLHQGEGIRAHGEYCQRARIGLQRVGQDLDKSFGFVPAFLATFGIKAFRFVTPLAWPETLIAPIVIAWVVIGIAVAVYLNRTRSRGVSGVRDLYAEAEPAGPVSSSTVNG